MYIVGVTAARNIYGIPQYTFTDVLDYLEDCDGFATGGCLGGDWAIGRYLAYRYPHKQHFVYLPADRWRVKDWWSSGKVPVQVVEMPAGTDYKYRNKAIVDASTELLGFPEYREGDFRSKRSGTWQTIRMARRASIPCRIHILRDA